MATKFKSFLQEIEDEAQKEGTEAIDQLKGFRDHYRNQVKKKEQTMALWKTVGGDVKQFDGKMAGGNKSYDGVAYEYKSLWDDDTQLDAFIDEFNDRIIKSQRGIIDGILTFFFSAK